MSLCPLEFRYGSNDMRAIFSRENIIKKMVEVELRLYKALEECGIVPKGYYEAFSKCVGSITVRPEEVDKREGVLGHDVVALLSILTDHCGDASRFLHYGATSNDVIDTVWGLLVRDALGLIKKKLVSSIRLLMRLTREYKDLIMVGRTHGQHALPITLGFKLANYVYELTRSLERLVDVESRVVRGKMAGAVGTMAGWRGKGLCVESVVMRELNLRPHEITTQVVPRDGFAELVSVIAILASQIERFTVEVRELMRPEILELAEGVGNRVGSSTMPHKANPVECEKISGLTRVLRGLVVPAIEDIVLWHERDLSNSSAERLLIPHTFMLIDEILDTFNEVLSNLKVYPENMIKNLKLSKGAIMSESLMLKLTDKGLSRYEAHRVVRELVTKALRSGSELIDVVLNEPEVLKYLSVDEVREALDYSKYLGNYNELIERTLKYAEEVIKSVST
jgi:adenylosuccinate lyase